jgi:predicted RNA-binding protein with PUA-like domain
MAVDYWLVKSEPESYSWATFVKEGRTAWTGVRNFAARNHLRGMKLNDRVFFYHSVSEKRVVGLARVARAAYPDPTAKEGDWSCVDLVPDKPFKRPVDIDMMKADALLADLPMFRQTRLSVMPVAQKQAERMLKLGEIS